MEILKDIIPYALPIITALVGWFGGTRKKKNDFLGEMQKSIDLLAAENTKLVAQVVGLNKEIASLNKEVVTLRGENEGLRAEIEKLNKRLENVKIINKKV